MTTAFRMNDSARVTYRDRYDEAIKWHLEHSEPRSPIPTCLNDGLTYLINLARAHSNILKS